MKKRAILALTTVLALSFTSACSKDKEDVLKENETSKPAENFTDTNKEESLIKESAKPEVKDNQSEEDMTLSELFTFYADHYWFGKYLKNMSMIGDSVVVNLHNSYKELKETNPYNISYNQSTFPDLYDKYVPSGNFIDLNAYLITRSTYVLANYPSIERIIINVPPDKDGNYYTMDVNREDLQYVLGFDVNTLKKSTGETDWGEKFNQEFASKYSYPLSDEAYDYNKRFLNVFSKQQKEPIMIKGEAKATLKTIQLEDSAIPNAEILIKQTPEYEKYLKYIENVRLENNSIQITFTNDFENNWDATHINYLSGRILAQFPELVELTLTTETHSVKIARDELTNYLGFDIASLVQRDIGEFDDWHEWDEKFSDVYVAGGKKESFFNHFN